jgi:hypothetical protein
MSLRDFIYIFDRRRICPPLPHKTAAPSQGRRNFLFRATHPNPQPINGVFNKLQSNDSLAMVCGKRWEVEVEHRNGDR